MEETRPIIAITMGDPAGCGPEIIAKMFMDRLVDDRTRQLCVGDAHMMERAFDIVGSSDHVRAILKASDACYEPGILDVIDLKNIDHKTLVFGEVQAAAGRAGYEYISRSIELAMNGEVDAVVTTPINKEALNLAGFHYSGHTEIFADKTHTSKVTMMLASKAFRVTHTSTHVSLREAIDRCKTPRILEVICLTNAALRQIGIETPKIAVAGLNPHCGENGMFGMEDTEQIQPAIDQARAEGITVYPQPVPADTVFVRMLHKQEFDCVVVQYHDQGHIPAKTLDFYGGVNITLGLPIIRVSVDHGTAFDIAGKGIAKPDSLVSAMDYAAIMANNSRK